MKQFTPILFRILLCLGLVFAAFLWATNLMDSLYAFRSPLHSNPPLPGEPLLPSDVPIPTRRLIFVLMDALRVDTANDPAIMPTLGALRQQAAWATMHSRPPSYSDPGYSALFTGAWPELSDGPAMNVEYEDTPTWTQDNLFSALKRRGFQAAVSAYYWFEKLIPQYAVSASFYTPGDDQAADRQVVDAALPWLHDLEYQLVFIHLDQVDYAGHYEGGPLDPRWNQAARRVDDMLVEILSELDLNQDTLLVLSDHGMIDRGGHGGHEAIVLQEPFILAGAGVKPGNYGDIDMVDVAPTLAALMGANIPASSQGRVLTEMLALPPEVTAALPEALTAQQGRLLDAYQAAIESHVTLEPGEDIVASHQDALESARSLRLQNELLPRFILAALLTLMLLVWFIWKRREDLPWYILASLIYLLLFNLRYALIDGRTYSLSSVASANDLILYTTSTAAMALLVSWMVTALVHKVFRRLPRQAAMWTLDLALFIVFLLIMPILWSYVLNGMLVTWTMPHFPSLFLGFLSLIQVLTVAICGLVITLASFIIGLMLKRRYTQSDRNAA
ncbi:MAG: hypothetical protein A2Z16_07495 [Chloroflexi bacterium RBG_16_54_18]|nr:MAG: hypothetical protein A2Z16_07495 [Chloroflexi bacterium RBG_16_54_18]